MIDSNKEETKGNRTMIAKLFKLFVFVFVAIVGIFALSIGIYAVSYEGRNDHSKFDQAITPSPLNQSNPAVVINSNLPLVRPSAVSRSANTPVRRTQFAQSIPSSQTNPNSRPISAFSRPEIATTFRAEPTFRPQQSVVKNQIQLQLNEARLQQMQLSQQYATNHPNVEMLDRKIEMLEAQLKAETDNTTTRPSLTPEQLELQQKIQRAEEEASRSANQLMNANFRDVEARRSVRENLKKVVQEAFDLRMQLQQAQLSDAAAKLEASRQRLNRRQSLAKQIVERRVNELLGRDETKWNRQASDAPNIVSANRVLEKTTQNNPNSTTYVELSAPTTSLVRPAEVIYAPTKESLSHRSAQDTPKSARLPQAESGLDKLILRDDGTTTHERSKALIDEGEARNIADNFVRYILSSNSNNANRLATSPEVAKFLEDVIFPRINTRNLQFIKCVIENNEARAFTKPFSVRNAADPNSVPTEAHLIVRMQKVRIVDRPTQRGESSQPQIEAWRIVEVGLGIADSKADNAWKTPAPDQSEYSRLLGAWEVVSIAGKGGKFMSLDESTKVGDKLLIPHIQVPKERLDRSKDYLKSPFTRLWVSDKYKMIWAKNDSLYLYPESSPARMTYRSKNGEKNHFSDSSDPPDFAIYKLDGDELTLMAGDPNDFKVDEGQETNRDSRGSPVHWKWRLVIPNYAKDFKLDPEKRQLLVKLRRVDPARAPAASPADKTDAIRTVPVGKAPPAFDFAPYKILFEKGSRKPESLVKKRTANGDSFPIYEHWAEAEPVEQFQGRWLVKRISINGKEVALDSAQANEVKMSNLIVFRNTLLANKPGGPEFFLLAYPNAPDA
ncbi:hypothetical protein OAG71_04815, partial [bacterium]|nr:hypothetical protein [bacterium]